MKGSSREKLAEGRREVGPDEFKLGSSPNQVSVPKPEEEYVGLAVSLHSRLG